MSNLEQSIAEWRQRMLAAGISAPALDELESHLREEVDRQMRSGFNERRAFEAAACQIGNGAELKKEFGKDKGLSGLLGEDKFARTERVLGVFWFVFCSRNLFLICHFGGVNLIFGFMIAIYGMGLYGSILLIRSAPMGLRIIRTIAAGLTAISLILFLMSWAVGQYLYFPHPPRIVSVTRGIFTVFYLVSACLLFLPSFSKPAPAIK